MRRANESNPSWRRMAALALVPVFTFGAFSALVGCQSGGTTASRSAALSEEEVTAKRRQLGNLKGNWAMKGWWLDDSGRKVPASGSYQGRVVHNYFLALEHQSQDETTKTPVTGSVIIGFEGIRGYVMTTAHSTSPVTNQFVGEPDGDESSITFYNVQMARPGRDVTTSAHWAVLEFSSPKKFVFDGHRRMPGGEIVIAEHYEFTAR